MYTVKCYKNTGFNAVNIPESLEFLQNNFSSVDFPSIDILQDENLSSCQIRGTWDNVKDIDYCVIGDECYIVSSVSMSSVDVAVLSLISDELTSCGGAGNLEYLDGVTSRHTVSDDSMFRYTQDDPYLAPNEALELETTDMLFDNGDVVATPVESTVDLISLGNEFNDDGTLVDGKGITFKDPADSQLSVTVPYTEGVSARTMYVIGDDTTGKLSPNTRLYENSDTKNDDGSLKYKSVIRGLAAVRALGIESALISQVAYPSSYIQVQIGEDGQYSFVRGKDQEVDTGLKFKYSDDVKNNRLFYGQYNTYGIVSASGSKGEYLPEQIADSTDDSPTVRSISDPRPDGKPYFRYKKYHGNDGSISFWMCCIGGMQWQSVPLTYTSQSGSYLNEINFKNSAQAAFNQEEVQSRTGYAGLASKGGLLGEAQSLFADVAMGMAQTIGSIGKWGARVVTGQYDAGNPWDDFYQNKYAFDIGSQRQINDQYTLARDKELSNYGVSKSVVVPTVLFPFNANMIRDFVGNGVVAYRYKYSSNDLRRIDRLLTMYGYRDTVKVDKSLFSKRVKFDYVQASGVSVGGSNISLWKKDVIAAQLSGGVRVWHVKPDVSAYDNNPIRVE